MARGQRKGQVYACPFDRGLDLCFQGNRAPCTVKFSLDKHRRSAKVFGCYPEIGKHGSCDIITRESPGFIFSWHKECYGTFPRAKWRDTARDVLHGNGVGATVCKYQVVPWHRFCQTRASCKPV